MKQIGLSLASVGVGSLAETPTVAGSFTFTLTAYDANGCTGSQSYTLLINCPAVSITCPADISVTTTNPGGEVVNYSAPTTSGGCAPVTVVCNPPSGSTFPVGTTVVTCTATDGQSNTATCTFTVTVVKFQSITGMKFNDVNGNSTKDADEPGLQGWTIQLRTTSGDILQSTVTDASGNYTFNNLSPGTYIVSEQQQSGWNQTYPASGSWSVTLAGSGGAAGRVAATRNFASQLRSLGRSRSKADLAKWGELKSKGLIPQPEQVVPHGPIV